MRPGLRARSKLNGTPLALSGHGSDGQARRAQHIAHVPEDRQREGLIMDFHAWENVAFGYHRDPAYKRGIFMDNAALRADTEAQDREVRRPPAKPVVDGQKLLGRQPAENRRRARD